MFFRHKRLKVAHITSIIDIFFCIDDFGVASFIGNANAIAFIRYRGHIQDYDHNTLFIFTVVTVDGLICIIRIDPFETMVLIVMVTQAAVMLIDV